ncbi:uncharacterized protein CLBA1 [Neofelis nebulosa]|uniref:uncharacterized protein CLBA1 n=1 Tax=Neofelis nebulosa TaxID=61452 RepID=UPI00272BDD18|nr:uncharacterized protein CLBA1 [Neofelis nebulosa]
MQGQRLRGAGPGHAPPVCGSPRAGNEGAGEVSLYRASRDSGASPAHGRRRGAGAQCMRSAPRTSGGGDGVSACTVSTPDPGEHSSAWGEFEGFQESSAKSPHFSQPFELRDRRAGRGLQSAASTPKERGSGQPQRGGPWAAGTPGTSASELILSYEDVFRFAFQEVPVQQATEGVSPLDRILEMSSEGKPGCGPGHILCSESRRLWGALQNTDSTSTSRWLWSESRCQENLLLVLGMDAARKNLSGDLGHILERSDLQEPEELGVRTVCAQPCRALVHTQLSGPSGGRQGSLTAWSLFLKTPLRSSGQYIPVPRKKKIFSPRNLKMTLFNSNVC